MTQTAEHTTLTGPFGLISKLFSMFTCSSPKDEDSYVSVRHVREGKTGDCLQDILKTQAQIVPNRHIIFYPLGQVYSTPELMSYSALYEEARSCSVKLAVWPGVKQRDRVLIYLDDHRDVIVWFWAVLLANGIPVLSPPLSNVEEHRKKHLHGLSQLLEAPICITRDASLALFKDTHHTLKLVTVESLVRSKGQIWTTAGRVNHPRHNANPSPAVLMLTSGSTGNAKAVCLSHKQILAAVSGKASVRPLPLDGAFLNWIGLDHVASLIEIHIQAMWLGMDQVHAQAADIVSSPTSFLDLLSRHRVSWTFAPNFFLAKLVVASDNGDGSNAGGHRALWDLSNLTFVASGGEANDTATCTASSSLFFKHGARRNVIVTGFGMTETCAGAIFNLHCPEYDLSKGLAVACVGHCIPGIEMRIINGVTGKLARPAEIGDLQVRGEVVFKEYYRNPAATADAFTADGWFITGDKASIDLKGNLRVAGRVKDAVIINGVKVELSDIQASLETTLRDTCIARVVAFPSRAAEAGTEQVTVAYIPKCWPPTTDEMMQVNRLAAQACMMVSMACLPLVFAVGDRTRPLLPISTLGKISRVKMRSLFEGGVFNDDIEYHKEVIFEGKTQRQQSVSILQISETEALLRQDFAMIKGIDQVTTIETHTTIFELGFTSMDIIRLKSCLETRLGFTVPVIVLMKNPTLQLLAAALDPLIAHWHSSKTRQTCLVDSNSAPTIPEYDPVVTLCSSGSKTPLWLIHPGVGEVLVFVRLAKHLRADNRPIYALRARGFEPGQKKFISIEETVSTYVTAIQRTQPHGPYALSGYSYGTMLAFEVAKVLQAGESHEEVRFLGSFNLPPHIKTRMRQLSWNMCILHLFQFLDLVTESCIESNIMSGDLAYQQASRQDALTTVLTLADASRLNELGLSRAALTRWADVAFGLQSMAVNYEPSGSVQGMDVFHAEPLSVAAASREEWVNEHLSRWEDFCETQPRFHEVGGAHYTMIGPGHVVGFAGKLQAALEARGV